LLVLFSILIRAWEEEENPTHHIGMDLGGLMRGGENEEGGLKSL